MVDKDGLLGIPDIDGDGEVDELEAFWLFELITEDKDIFADDDEDTDDDF